jgi:hypothetical protein
MTYESRHRRRVTIAALTEEIESRAMRTRAIPLYYYPAPRSGPRLVPPGSVCFIVAQSGNTTLKAVRAALRQETTASRAIIARLYDSFRIPVVPESREDYLRRLLVEPIICEVRYGGRALASVLRVPSNRDLRMVFCPYNGGHIAPHGFALVEYIREASVDPLDAIAICSRPQLSRAERETLRDVPPDQLELNVGRGIHSAAPYYWVEVLAVLAVLAVGAYSVYHYLADDDNNANDNNNDADDDAQHQPYNPDMSDFPEAQEDPADADNNPDADDEEGEQEEGGGENANEDVGYPQEDPQEADDAGDAAGDDDADADQAPPADQDQDDADEDGEDEDHNDDEGLSTSDLWSDQPFDVRATVRRVGASAASILADRRNYLLDIAKGKMPRKL